MDDKQFYTQFAGLTIISAILVGLSALSPALQPHLLVAWGLLVFFSLFVWLGYIFGKRAAMSTNKNDFTRLIILLIFMKMGACLLIVVAYDATQPPDTYYLIHFLVLYLLYSIFEYRILSKLGYQK